jgi:RHS repeat-associated protein
LQDELDLNVYDYGARMYDPADGRWWQMDVKAEKYLNLSPYVYVADNPMTNIDPDGKDIIFIIRGENGNADRSLTYRKGNFYHDINTGRGDGKRYNPEKESVSPTMYKVLSAYRKIEKSNDSRLKGVLHSLETSKLHHYVEAGSKSAVSAYGIPSTSEKDSPVGTRTTYNFSKKDDAEYEKTEGTTDSDDAAVAHEMRHQFDYDIGNMADNKDENDEKDPSEIRAVFFENLMRKTLKQLERKQYGKPIDPKDLKEPPSNRFK